MNILVSGSLAYDKIMTYPGMFSDQTGHRQYPV